MYTNMNTWAQIENRLREVYGETGTGELSHKDVAACSSYLARKTLDSVGDIFIGANQVILAWLVSPVCRLLCGCWRGPPDLGACERAALTEQNDGTRCAQTMAWLSQVAQRVAATGRPVQWVTPIGLPVTQVWVHIRLWLWPCCGQLQQ